MARLDHTAITEAPDGTVMVRWIKEDGSYHRTAIPRVGADGKPFDMEAQLDEVDRHLALLEGDRHVKPSRTWVRVHVAAARQNWKLRNAQAN